MSRPQNVGMPTHITGEVADYRLDLGDRPLRRRSGRPAPVMVTTAPAASTLAAMTVSRRSKDGVSPWLSSPDFTGRTATGTGCARR